MSSAHAPVLDDANGGMADSAKRQQILDGARAVFLAEGFDGASMGQIAKVAGVSKGTLYVYFDSKEMLFETLILKEKQDLAEALFRLDASDPDVRSVLRRLGLSFLDKVARPDHVASVRMVIGAAEKFPRFGRVYFEAGPCHGVSRLKAYLDAQVAAGRLAIPDTQLAARQFMDLCGSWIMKRLLFCADDVSTPAEHEYQVEAALRMFFAAYGVPAR